MTNHNQQAMPLPIDRKMLLSIREAAKYSNIGINKIDDLLKQPNCPFVLYVGTKKLVKRKAFEEFIEGKVAILQQSDFNWYAPKMSKHIEMITILC